MTASPLTTIIDLIWGMEDDRDNPTRKLVLADALDDCGMCGDSLRWAARMNKRPIQSINPIHDRYWYICRHQSVFDNGVCVGDLPPCFEDHNGRYPPGRYKTPIEAWTWFIGRFEGLRKEGKI
jgi:hypothetical protein